MDFSELALHPVRLRVLQHIRVEGSCTAKDIARALDDVPRATVYRQVKALEEGGAIEVERTRHVRGAVEKTYVLAERLVSPCAQDARALSAAMHLASMSALDAYFAREGANGAADRVFFQIADLWVTDGEYDELLASLASVLEPYVKQSYSEGRRRRSLSLISAPPATYVMPGAEGNHEGSAR